MTTDERSPRERFITVYGRMPVLEALSDPDVGVNQVLVSRQAKGDSIEEIMAAAARRGITVGRVSPERVTRVSRNGRHDQGVVADVDAPGLVELEAWLADHPAPVPAALLVLDGVTNPANVGMIIRSATAAGLGGIVLPRAGSPEVGPLVIKASAGVAFRAAILRVVSAAEAIERLSAAGFDVLGLRGEHADDLWTATLGPRVALVLGNETEGVSRPVESHITRWLRIPLAGGVESLNVAAAGAVVCYELARRAAAPDASTATAS
jgi:23S rRNA (guanosine2251-2'-O)-methyltransferase